MRNLNFLSNRLSSFLKEHAAKKIVIVINSYDKVSRIAAAIKHPMTKTPADVGILCFKSRIPRPFSRLGLKITISEDYLSADDCLKIDGHVFDDISRNWDETQLKKSPYIFKYRGVDLARIAEYDLQLFLLSKVKALLVFDRAIKKEKYEAVFIVDSNGEFDSFDKFLQRCYHIPAMLVNIDETKSRINVMKSIGRRAVSGLARVFFQSTQKAKPRTRFIDAKLFSQLGIKKNSDFVLADLTGGVASQINLLFKNEVFISFDSCTGPDIGSNKRPNAQGADLRDIENRFIFEGLSYWPLVESKIHDLILKDFARFRKNMDIFTNAVRTFNIRLVILRNDVREIEKTIVLASKNLNLSTLVIQHGILAESNGHNRIFADKIAVWGDYSVRWYKHFGNDPQKTVVTGNPNFDGIRGYGGRTGQAAGKKYSITLITTGIGPVKFSSFMTDDTTENLIIEVISAVKSIGNANLAIRLHPNEKRETFSGLIKEEDRDFVSIAQETDLYDLLRSSDLVVTIDSTVGLEALMMGKPLVVVDLGRRRSAVPYVESGAAVGAYKSEEIADAIRKALEDGDVKKRLSIAGDAFVRDHAYRTDGRSRERVTELIEGQYGK